MNKFDGSNFPTKNQVYENILAEFLNDSRIESFKKIDLEVNSSLTANMFKDLIRNVNKLINVKFTNKLSSFSYRELNFIVFHSYIYSVQFIKTPLKNGMMHQNIQNSYHQQPCTYETRKNRAQLIKNTYPDLDTPILLLGDDDLLCLELVKLNYTQVTVIDIDAKLIKVINQHRLPQITAYCHDFNNPFPAHMINDYKLVFADPSYTAEGIKLFINAAQSLCKSKTYNLMICLCYMYLTVEEIKVLQEYFIEHNIKLRELLIGFNLYDRRLTDKYIMLSFFFSLKFLGYTLSNAYKVAIDTKYYVSDLLICESQGDKKEG